MSPTTMGRSPAAATSGASERASRSKAAKPRHNGTAVTMAQAAASQRKARAGLAGSLGTETMRRGAARRTKRGAT